MAHQRLITRIPGLPPLDADDAIWNMAPVYREGYVTTKYCVAKSLQPRRICEIGVYSGISAMCFLHACPEAEYIGIDDLSTEHGRGIAMVNNTILNLRNLGYRGNVFILDTQTLDNLPGEFDFIHVDGDHSYRGAMHDVTLAWKALSSGGHILVDNGHDSRVAAATFEAINSLAPGLIKWNYLSESVGSILIWRPA